MWHEMMTTLRQNRGPLGKKLSFTLYPRTRITNNPQPPNTKLRVDPNMLIKKMKSKQPSVNVVFGGWGAAAWEQDEVKLVAERATQKEA